jgi:hypothetical protein
MKSLVALTTAFIKEAASQYELDPSKDIETVLRRLGEEGEPFLTITLDAYRTAFEAALEAGTWDNIHIPGFRKDGRLPAFLRGFVSLVFQRNGRIRPEVDFRAVICIRQILGFAAKMKLPCKPEYVARALDVFKDVDAKATVRATADLKAVFADLFDPVLRDVLADIDSFSVVVKHGDGASQEKVPPNSRWNFTHWDARCEPYFPSRLYAYVNDSHAAAAPVEFCTAESAPVRVTTVPKTAKGPRIIAVEPSWRMYIQQGLLRALVHSIERRGLPPRFSDSSHNRDLAREGSVTGQWATIDLSNASDSVSSALVRDLLSGRPDFRDALFACRSPQAMLPDGTTLALNKFASMGSATCFPIEAMVFAAVAVLAMAPRNEGGQVILPVDRKVVGRVTVYGDDIIVPSTAYTAVTDALALFGFSVNLKKSFVKGRFRESCGGDFFDGHDVHYVKLRQPMRFTVADAVETVSTVSFRNQLAATGLWPAVVRELDRRLMDGLRLFPYGTERSPGLVRVGTPEGAAASPHVGRFSRRLFQPEQKAFVGVPEFQRDVLDGWGGLHKSLRLAERRNGPQYHPTSYEVAGRAVRVRLIARWLSVG